MSTSVPPLPGLLWLHWILANATSVGVAHAIPAFLSTIDDKHSSPVGFVLVIPLAIAVLMLIGYSQQVVLHRVFPSAEYWFALMPLNFMLGVSGLVPGAILLGVFIALHEVVIPGPPSLIESLISVGCAGMFFGAGFGLLQTSFVCETRRQTALWLVASGGGFTLAFMAEVMLWEYVLVRSQQFSTVGVSSLLGTMGGTVYGVVTGLALIYLRPMVGSK